MGRPGRTRHYYVDEAGDGTLFSRRGRLLVDTEGCSRYFILGYVDIADPEAVSAELDELRRALLADPYFRNVPSMQPKARKTALAFHAKDDVPEVRREVFDLLLRHDLHFCAEVKDKMQVLLYVQQRSGTDPAYRYEPNELYDYLVRRLFKNALHKADVYDIYFARRGKSDRTAALLAALEHARERFKEQWGIASRAPINIRPCRPPQCAGLQVVDYLLWALQRFYERGEERYIEYLWSKYSLVHDIDNVRDNLYGVNYSKKKPLIAAKKETPGI